MGNETKQKKKADTLTISSIFVGLKIAEIGGIILLGFLLNWIGAMICPMFIMEGTAVPTLATCSGLAVHICFALLALLLLVGAALACYLVYQILFSFVKANWNLAEEIANK